ncbi:pyridoxamine 5'-phosphate oxidase family protein [Aureibaculum conchae]|uniref:pyridoxamine 5'-phosphate oxidase family protein n=1 Tax=Aureibaculum sp. 2308TA14-22 TaxID=3108392 RepID=UPI003399342D
MIKKIGTKESIIILENNYIGYLSYIAQNTPYVVPVTYFFDRNSNNLLFYSADGHKIKAMRNYYWVSMLVTEIRSVNDWNSVLVHGRFNELEGINSKAKLHDFSRGVKELIRIKEHKKMDFINEFSSKAYQGKTPIVYQVKDIEITGRKRRT